MQDQAICSPAEADDMVDQAVLGLLFDAPGPWAVDEVIREIGDPVQAEDSLARLSRAGLVHRLDSGFVFLSRAAVRAEALHG